MGSRSWRPMRTTRGGDRRGYRQTQRKARTGYVSHAVRLCLLRRTRGTRQGEEVRLVPEMDLLAGSPWRIALRARSANHPQVHDGASPAVRETLTPLACPAVHRRRTHPPAVRLLLDRNDPGDQNQQVDLRRVAGRLGSLDPRL